MFSTRVLGRYVIPAMIVTELKKSEESSKTTEKLCRASELPIYSPEPLPRPFKKEPEPVPGYLEDAIRTVRETYTKFANEFKAYQTVALQYYTESKDNAQWLVNYLQEENNTTPKAGAIAIGGLTGLIFGLRGGKIKKTIYAATGALAMAALSYPKETTEYSRIGLTEGKKYATIAYNFAYGVKKDDPPLELPSLPTIPISLTDIWTSVKNTATSFVSDEQPEPVKVPEPEKKEQVQVKTVDPMAIVTESHDQAESKSCHCPIGSCLGQHEESPPPTVSLPMPGVQVN